MTEEELRALEITVNLLNQWIKQQRIDMAYYRWRQEEDELKKEIKDFDLNAAVRDPVFCNSLAKSGSVKKAYMKTVL